MAAAVKESFRSVHALAGASADADFDAFFRKVTLLVESQAAQRPPRRLRRARQDPPRARPPRELRHAGSTGRRACLRGRCRADAVHAAYLPVGRICRRSHRAPAVAAGNARSDDYGHVGIVGRDQPRDRSQARHSRGRRSDDSSPRGTIELPAFLYPGLRPDVIAIPVGQGIRSSGVTRRTAARTR